MTKVFLFFSVEASRKSELVTLKNEKNLSDLKQKVVIFVFHPFRLKVRSVGRVKGIVTYKTLRDSYLINGTIIRMQVILY